MRISFEFTPGQFSKAELVAEQQIARAATDAIHEAADLAKERGRAAIAAGGFGTRWQNALRSKVFPQSGISLNPAALVWHNIPYAGVFEEGATIPGRPLEWLPLDSVPKSSSGSRMTPQELVGAWGKLISIERPGKPPILAAVVKGGKSGPWGATKFTAKQIRAGGSKRGAVHIVPLFIGVPTVRDPKKFDVVAAIESVADELPVLFARNFEE